jgi:UDP-N-acetylenolpyruvoylglucosamine reductase
MNAGAYGSEMKDIVKCAHIMSKDGSKEYTLSVDEVEL